MNRAPAGAERRDLRAGLGALVALLVLLVGVPAGLWALAGWPLPTSMPSWSSISDALRTTHIPDTVLAKGLALVCWLVWIELVASVLVESVAMIRGRQAGDVPLAGPLQKFAGRLVASVGLLLLLAAARGEAPETVARPLLVPGTAAVVDLAAADPVVTPAQQGLPTYVVQPRDTLWDIAERHLEDPMRWGEIWELNREQPQADGTTFTNPDLICPGWQLALPADAVGLGSPAVAEAASVELLTPIEEDDPAVLLAVDHDVELLTPLDAPTPADHAR
jgi:hypothetical protein